MSRFVEVICFRCKIAFGMDATLHAAALIAKEGLTFYCPLGHGQSYITGPSEADKLRLERDRLKQEAARLEDEKRRAWDRVAAERENTAAAERRASAARGQVTRLKNRAAAGVCPCCNRTFSQLQRHMTAKHPTFRADTIAEGASIQ